jgi:heme oxygenase
MASTLDRLRDHTRAQHEALHVHPFMRTRFLTALDRPAYTHFLQGFVAPWRTLHARLETHPLPGLTSRWPDLAADLDALGTTPDPDPLALPTGRPATLGLAYVLLGSAGGARGLRMHVGRALPDAPTRYLDPGPADASWTNLLALLDDAPPTPPLLDAAERAFAHVGQRWSA